VNRKVVMVGLDGGTFDLSGPWAEEGKLPNMAWLMKNCTGRCLASTFPPVTPIAWASFIFWTKSRTFYGNTWILSSKKYGDAILQYYQRIDDVIGEILRRIDPNTTMIIMSDHGIGPLYKRVHVNYWLKKIGC